MRLAERRNGWAWNRALAAGRKAVNRVATHLRLTPNARQQLVASLLGLRRNPAALRVPTNEELTRRYGVSRRTIQYWRQAGCPFAQGRAQVADWLVKRPSLPRACQEKVARELEAARGRLARREVGSLAQDLRNYGKLERLYHGAIKRGDTRQAALAVTLLRGLVGQAEGGGEGEAA